MRKEKRMQTSKKKKNKITKVLIVLVIILICILSFFFIKSTSKKDVPKKQIQSNTLSSSEVQQGKNIREAMNSVINLYEDPSEKKLKQNLNASDIKKVKKSIDKLEDGNLKKELNKRIDEINAEIK